MVDAILGAARASHFGEFMWHRAKPYLTTLFDLRSPSSLDRVVALVSPYVAWDDMLNGTDAVARWAAAALAVPYTEEVGQSVVDALFQIASINSLRSHIPIDLWAWLKRLPSLPPVCLGRINAAQPEVVHYVRGLKNIEILKSFFLLIWSEWSYPSEPRLNETEISIREDFSGAGMREHRKDLMERLDYVLEQLNLDSEYLIERNPSMNKHRLKSLKDEHEMLKKVLLEVDEEPDAQACAFPKSIASNKSADPL